MTAIMMMMVVMMMMMVMMTTMTAMMMTAMTRHHCHDEDGDDDRHLGNGCKKFLNGSDFPARQAGVEVPRMEEIHLLKRSPSKICPFN